MKKLLLLLFVFFGIYYSYSQDHSIQNWTTKANIVDNSNKVIGYIKVTNRSKINYYNINGDLLKYEVVAAPYNFTLTHSNFLELKEKDISVNIYNKYGTQIGTRFWNKNINEYDVFNDDDLLIANYKYSQGRWRYKETTNYKTDSDYVNIYKIEKPKTSSTNVVSYNKNTSTSQNNTSSSYTSNKKNNNRWIFPEYFTGLYVGASRKNLEDSYQQIIPEYKFEIGYFTWDLNYFGLQFATQKSDLIYQDDYDELNDQIWALSYGRAFTDNGSFLDAFLIKTALGYHTYNYNTVESFGAFYDIGEKFYADIGIKFFLLDFGGVAIIPEFNVDIDGNIAYGIGVGIEL
jgi:hypothetical protein